MKNNLSTYSIRHQLNIMFNNTANPHFLRTFDVSSLIKKNN